MDHEVKRLRPSWPHGETPSLLKIQKISGAWLHVPVVTATSEAEAGESLEPGRQRLQSAKIEPLYSSLVTEQDCLKKKKKNTKSKMLPLPLPKHIYCTLISIYNFYSWGNA